MDTAVRSVRAVAAGVGGLTADRGDIAQSLNKIALGRHLSGLASRATPGRDTTPSVAGHSQRPEATSGCR